MQIEKAIEMMDAKIQFVSLVDKAANKRRFLITKAENGQAQFTTYGRIIKADAQAHLITGIVYEPMTEDTDGNFMTAEEIEKAAHWFAKHSNRIDLQHNFEALEGAYVVENWVAKSDMVVGDEEVKKGTWLITVETENAAVWDAVQKGELTGFSMGGIGKYGTEDIPLDKAADKPPSPEEKKGIFKKLAGFFGLDVVEKGDMTDEFQRQQKSSGFWNAVNTLTDLLARGYWDYQSDRYVYDFENNETLIRSALEEFSTIVTGVLAEGNLAMTLSASPPDNPILKAGKKMSSKNKQKLDEITNALAAFAKEFDENNIEEDTEVNKEEIQKMIDESIQKASTPPADPPPAAAAGEGEALTTEAIQKMVEEAVQKAMNPDPEPLTAETIQEFIDESVQKAMDPILKARGIATNLNDQGIGKEQKPHYLTGIL